MKLIVSGTREPLSDDDQVRVMRAVLSHVRGSSVCVGDCPTGVDALVRRARESIPFTLTVFTADWDGLGRRAGPERNGAMIAWAALDPEAMLLAFPSPRSRGTWDCIRQAVRAGLRVVIEPVGVQR